MSEIQTSYRMLGDTRTPLGTRLVQGTRPVDLSSLTVQFRMVSEAGVVIRDWTATGVVVVNAPQGKVQYDFRAEDVDTAGIFWAWFRAGANGEWDTFPAEGRRLRIVISQAV